MDFLNAPFALDRGQFVRAVYDEGNEIYRAYDDQDDLVSEKKREDIQIHGISLDFLFSKIKKEVANRQLLKW